MMKLVIHPFLKRFICSLSFVTKSCPVPVVSFKVAQNAVCYWLLVDILYEIKLPMFPKKDTQRNHRLVHHICYEHESQFHTIFIAQYYNNVQTEA